MYYMGVDLGGTNIAAAIVNEKMEIVARGKIPTRAERGAEEIVADMGTLCRSLMQEQGLTFDDFAYAGIGTPGIANDKTGTVNGAFNIGFLNDFPLKKLFYEAAPFSRIFIANDANAAALGEAMAGAAKGVANVIVVTLGTGVGGGIILNHKLYTGSRFGAGELGHIIIAHNGRQCSCGDRGCWEAYSSATALIKYTKEVMRKNRQSQMWAYVSGDINAVDGRTAFETSKKGDAAAQKVVDWYIDHLTSGIISMSSVFQPDILCIGGGVCGQGDYLLRPILDKLSKTPFPCDVRIAQLGNDAGILGAAALGL